MKEYKRIDKIFDSLYEEKEKEDAKPIHLAGFLNLAACHLKLNDHLEAAKACDKVRVSQLINRISYRTRFRRLNWMERT